MDKAKQYLMNIQNINIRLEALTRERDKLNTILIGSARLNDTKVTTSFTNTSENAFLKYIEESDKMQDVPERICNLIAEKHEAFAMIEQIQDPRYVNILMLRYFSEMEWHDIAKRLNYSRGHTTKLHSQALNEFREIYQREVMDNR